MHTNSCDFIAHINLCSFLMDLAPPDSLGWSFTCSVTHTLRQRKRSALNARLSLVPAIWEKYSFRRLTLSLLYPPCQVQLTVAWSSPLIGFLPLSSPCSYYAVLSSRHCIYNVSNITAIPTVMLNVMFVFLNAEPLLIKCARGSSVTEWSKAPKRVSPFRKYLLYIPLST